MLSNYTLQELETFLARITEDETREPQDEPTDPFWFLDSDPDPDPGHELGSLKKEPINKQDVIPEEITQLNLNELHNLITYARVREQLVSKKAQSIEEKTPDEITPLIATIEGMMNEKNPISRQQYEKLSKQLSSLGVTEILPANYTDTASEGDYIPKQKDSKKHVSVQSVQITTYPIGMSEDDRAARSKADRPNGSANRLIAAIETEKDKNNVQKTDAELKAESAPGNPKNLGKPRAHGQDLIRVKGEKNTAAVRHKRESGSFTDETILSRITKAQHKAIADDIKKEESNEFDKIIAQKPPQLVNMEAIEKARKEAEVIQAKRSPSTAPAISTIVRNRVRGTLSLGNRVHKTTEPGPDTIVRSLSQAGTDGLGSINPANQNSEEVADHGETPKPFT